MDKKEEEFLKHLQATFRVEADEHVQSLFTSLIELEKTTDAEKKVGLIETLFREAHSLKGAARSVNIREIESICQALESAFAKIKRKEIALSLPLYDLIHSVIDTIAKLVSDLQSEKKKEENPNTKILIKELQTLTEAAKQAEANVPETEPSLSTREKEETRSDLTGARTFSNPTHEEKALQIDTVRISTSKLNHLFLQAEEMIQTKIALARRTEELYDIKDSIELLFEESAKWKVHQSTDEKNNRKELAAWNGERLTDVKSKLQSVAKEMDYDNRMLAHMVDDHLESMKDILMLPVSTITELFPKVVRDLAHDQQKEIELFINGADIELDKRILDELKDPFLHLLRNCIDHGIQLPAERKRLNKSPKGKITLNFATAENRNLRITISDDGGGIALDKVVASAIKNNTITKSETEKLSAKELLPLIFKSGISTSPIITEISGRGLGLAISQEKIERLGGSITLESNSATGTSFTILVPMSLTTFRGILVKTGDRFFIIPTNNVERTLRLKKDEIKTVENKETISLDGQIISTVNLGSTLGLLHTKTNISKDKNGNGSSAQFIYLLVISNAVKRIAFQVDEIFEDQQVLIKELGSQLKRVRNISGATVLGSGKVVPILNVADLMESAFYEKTAPVKTEEKIIAAEKNRILVVEDSVTSRTLLKNILESSGYEVDTAFDGIDGCTKAMVGNYHLIVSDVDMPRMNGFELTARIRREKKLADLPVVLVTALESREDREHGIDVGADAYIVKSSFDQSNLLDIIRKLL